MNIEKLTTHTKLGTVIYSIQKSPESWEEWKCLYIDSPIVLNEDYDEISAEVDEMIKSYLNNIQATAYITEEKNIMLLAKNVQRRTLEELAINLMYLLNKVALTDFDHRIFYLPTMVSELSSYHMKVKLNNKNGNELITENKKEIKSILIVDDDPFTCKLLFNTLHDKHYIIVAGNGEEALREYNKYHPDLVLLDINMPKLGGREVLSEIVDLNPDAKIVMFSSNDNVENISSCINGGASGFLSKPFNRSKIEEYIANL